MEPAEPSVASDRARLRGEVQGLRVELSQWQANWLYLELRAYWRAPADLGLTPAPASLWDKLAAGFGGQDVTVGDPAFDRAIRVGAHEPARVRALRGPALRDALASWIDAGSDFVITDECVLCDGKGPCG
jgi:hypothetical protein